MKFLSLCSGIEAASVAFGPLGWKAVAFAEIEPFPSAVLAHHYPDVPNLGDMTKFADWPEEVFIEADAIVGGPPCQAFSVAGLRKGLDDERGNLTLTYFHLINHADEVRAKHGRPPVIALYENVPGLLSDKTGAFGSLLAGLAGEDEAIALPKWPRAGVVDGGRRRVAWATLDAQYFGLAQRRRRVFVLAVPGEFVERLGDRAHPAEILSIGKGLRRDTPSRSSARQGTAPGTEAGAGSGGYVPDATGALTARSARNGGQSNDDVDGHKVITMAHGQGGAEIGYDRGPTLTCIHEAPIAAYPAPSDDAASGIRYAHYSHDYANDRITDPSGVNPAITNSPTASGNLNVMAPVAMVNMQGSKGSAVAQADGPSFTLQSMHGHDVHAIAVPVGVTLHGTDGTQSVASMTEVSSSLRARIPSGVENSTTTAVLQPVAGSHWDAPENPHPTLNQSAKGSGGIAASDQELFSQRGAGLVPVAYRVHGEHSTAMTANGNARVADPVEVARALDTCGGYATNQGGNVVAQPVEPTPAYTFRADAMRDGVAKTPSPDAEGRVRLRDPGMGMYEELAPTLDCGAAHGVAQPVEPFTLAIRGRGDARDLEHRQDGTANALVTPNGGRDGMGVGAVAAPVAHAFDARQSDVIQYGDKTGPLDTDGHTMGVLAPTLTASNDPSRSPQSSEITAQVAAVLEATTPMAFDAYNQKASDVSHPLRVELGNGTGDEIPQTMTAMQVRRLTPVECERLQGFPDGYTAIPWRGKPAEDCPDGPRYKALGNSWAVPVVRWIGSRIDEALKGFDEKVSS